jgi:hypothetical protein
MVATGAALGADAYVCILKSKQAELDAIDGVPTDSFVPLMEVTGSDKAAAIARKWAAGELIWIQPVNLKGADDVVFAADIAAIFAALRVAGIAAVPTAFLDDTPETSAALAAAVATDGHGAVLRLDAEDLVTTPPAATRSDIDDFLRYYGIEPEECDLVLDASLVRDSVAARVATLESAMAAVPHLSDWRSLVVAQSAFPTDLGAQMGKDTVQAFPRADRAAYLTLGTRGPARMPTYADFGVGQPTYADIAFSPIPSIKYTDVSDWQVHRGAQRSNPSPQYISLATGVSRAAYFRGAGFSRGDAYIDNVAKRVDGPGNATTYLRAAMSHHIHHVLDRFASHGEP